MYSKLFYKAPQFEAHQIENVTTKWRFLFDSPWPVSICKSELSNGSREYLSG